VVVRTATTAAWLLDVVPEVLDDVRVQLLFTIAHGSAYEDGAIDTLNEADVRVVPWEQATSSRFDLAICASHSGALDELDGPLLVLPHGPGYTRLVSVPSAGWARAPRNSSDGAPTTVVLSHGEQRRQWDGRPGVHTEVTGDPCFDALLASTADRDRLRSALGVHASQRLVVVSSTWGGGALLGTRPELPSELLATLPSDENVVAAILHSNVWIAHGRWQVRTWLQRALDAGLRLVPYQAGWRGTVAAADCVVGDHGSVTFYAATIGVPVILAAYAPDELVAGSPLAALGELAPRLDDDARHQIETVAGPPDPERYAEHAARMFAYRGEALVRLRRLVYELIDLTPPRHLPRVLRVGLPRPETRRVDAHRVVARVRTDIEPLRVTLERSPAALGSPQDSSLPESHLVVDDRERDYRLRESAAVLVRRDHPADPGWCAATLGRYPGCRVALAAGTPLTRAEALVRGGPALLVDIDNDGDALLAGCAIYAVSITRTADSRWPARVDLTAGARGASLRITRRESAGAPPRPTSRCRPAES
jgi:hypothetical protein